MPFVNHPDLGETVEVAESQVRVLEKSGWRRVELADLSKPSLIGAAKKRGIPIPKSATKAEIAKAIESTEPEEA
jgi:hypothetical protein